MSYAVEAIHSVRCMNLGAFATTVDRRNALLKTLYAPIKRLRVANAVAASRLLATSPLPLVVRPATNALRPLSLQYDFDIKQRCGTTKRVRFFTTQTRAATIDQTHSHGLDIPLDTIDDFNSLAKDGKATIKHAHVFLENTKKAI